MAWVLLILAGLLEALWATTLKASYGFTHFWPSVVTVVTMLVSFFMLSVAMKTLPLGLSYTVWAGIGALGAFIAGLVLHGETLDLTRGVAFVLILAGLGLMKLSA